MNTDQIKGEISSKINEAYEGVRDSVTDPEKRAQLQARAVQGISTAGDYIGRAVHDSGLLYDTVADAAEANRQKAEANLAYFRDYPAQADRRLAELDEEWDTRRVLQIATSGLSLAGLWWGFTKSRIWLLLPLLSAGGALHHGITGSSPAEDFVRRAGFRTRDEIDHERNGLRALRGGGEPQRDAQRHATASQSGIE